LIDFLAGRVDVMIDNVHFPHAKTGKVTLLAVTTDKRHPDFPDVPTMEEAGYGVELGTPSSLYAPRGTPQEIIDRLAAAMREITSDPEMQAKVLKIGFFPVVTTPKELADRHQRLTASFAEWVKKTNLKIE
jgi:tripartite-type tricarboxylate transporter receptor subunit TctC